MVRITEKTDFKAHGYDKEGKLIATINDSGYRSVQSVLDGLRCKAFYGKKVAEFSIETEDNFARYKVVGGGFRRLYGN